MHGFGPPLVVCAALTLAPTAAAQTRTARWLQLVEQRIAANQLDSADAALREALDVAAYQIDSVGVFVWRGILEHLRGSDSLARDAFRRAVTLDPLLQVDGLQEISPRLAQVFDGEARAARVYAASDLGEKPARVSGPGVVYPRDLRRRRVTGLAVVSAVLDTLGRVEPRSVVILETPDSGLVEPLKQMMLATTFTPGRVGGRPVRSRTSLAINLTPPAIGSPTPLITAARRQIAARRVDSALALLDEALSPAATEGERVYALLVQGLAWTAKRRDSLASTAFDSALAAYSDLTARGVDLAPFLRRLADSVRIARRRAATPPPSPAAAPLARPTTVEPVDEQPALVSHPPIRYAPEMQALRIGGTVIVEATLDTTGRVVPATVRIVQSPNPIFDVEARRVVIAAAYRPARTKGRPVRAVIRQPITFAPY